MDLTNKYISTKYSLDRYLEDFRSGISSEVLLGYTWNSPTEAVTESIIDMERYFEHISKKLGPGFPGFKDHEISSFIPREGSGQLSVFPARKRLPEGENDPWELSTGRQTTQPRRTRTNVANKSSKRSKNITCEKAISDQTSIQPGVHSSGLSELSPLLSPFQGGTKLLLDQLLASSPLSGPLPSISKMSQSSSPLVHHSSDAINNAQFIQCYPSTIPDQLSGLKQKAMTAPLPSIEQIHKDNTTPIFQLRRDNEVDRRPLPYSMLEAVPSSGHGTFSTYGNGNSSTRSSNDSTWPSVTSLVFGSSSEWSSTSSFTFTSDYSMPDFLDEFDSNMEPVSPLSGESTACENDALEERYNDPADATFDWNEFLNFQDVVKD